MAARPKSTAALIQAVRMARINPHARFLVPGDFDMTSRDVLGMWRRGVQVRASRGLPELSARGQQRYAELKRQQFELHLDQRAVDDYTQRRIRHTGCRNLLRTAWMQRMYPHINNQPRED